MARARRLPVRVESRARVDVTIERVASRDAPKLSDARSAVLNANVELSRGFALLPPSAGRARAHHIANDKCNAHARDACTTRALTLPCEAIRTEG